MATKKKNRLPKLLAAGMALILMAAAAAKLPSVWRDLSFGWTEHSAAQLQVKAYANAHGVRYGAYPESLIALLERNPETEDFVLNYPFRQESPIDMAEFDRSQGVPLMMQWDTRWGYLQYGADVVGLTGCGPVCLAMAGWYVTGDEKFSPDRVVDFALKNGYCSYGNGSSWTLISEGGEKLGLDVTEIPLVKGRILDNLEAGNPIICVMGPGDFTATGHFIVLVGTEDGMIRVNDPNSRANSARLWSYEEMESQFRNLWVIRSAG